MKKSDVSGKMQASTKNEFLGMAVHDLRTPIHKISFASELLLSGQLDEEKQQDFLHLIHRTAVGMTDLINDLLDLTKIESGSIAFERTEVESDRYFAALFSDQLFIAEQKEIQLHIDVPADLPNVSIDQRRITQVVNNLVSNAVKYSKRGSDIRVSAKRSDGGVRVEVTDSGPGIPEKEQEELFQPFHRLQAEPTEGEHSTGLGLAICHKIVEGHGGKIGVQSTPGSGSTFYFVLPAA